MTRPHTATEGLVISRYRTSVMGYIWKPAKLHTECSTFILECQETVNECRVKYATSNFRLQQQHAKFIRHTHTHTRKIIKDISNYLCLMKLRKVKTTSTMTSWQSSDRQIFSFDIGIFITSHRIIILSNMENFAGLQLSHDIYSRISYPYTFSFYITRNKKIIYFYLHKIFWEIWLLEAYLNVSFIIYCTCQKA